MDISKWLSTSIFTANSFLSVTTVSSGCVETYLAVKIVLSQLYLGKYCWSFQASLSWSMGCVNQRLLKQTNIIIFKLLSVLFLILPYILHFPPTNLFFSFFVLYLNLSRSLKYVLSLTLVILTILFSSSHPHYWEGKFTCPHSLSQSARCVPDFLFLITKFVGTNHWCDFPKCCVLPFLQNITEKSFCLTSNLKND